MFSIAENCGEHDGNSSKDALGKYCITLSIREDL